MKSTVIVVSLVGLIGTTLSLPTSREEVRALPGCTSDVAPNADSTISAIKSWSEDVATVNTFLNTAPSLSGTALSDAATTAFAFANNEPAELGILACIPLGDAANDAIQTLASVFGSDVLNPLETIINEPTNTEAVTSAIDLINSIRCCTVLPSVNVLWPAAAKAFDVENKVAVVAPLEDACSTVSC